MQPPLLFVIATVVAFAVSGKAVPQFGYEDVHGYEKDPVLQQFDVIDQYERIKQDIVKPFQTTLNQQEKDNQQPAEPQAEDKEKPLNPVEAEIEAKEKPVSGNQGKQQGEAKSNYDYEPEFDERKDTYGHYKEQADLEFNIKDTISNLAFKKLPPVYKELDKLAKWDGDEKVDDEDKDDEDTEEFEAISGQNFGGRDDRGYNEHESRRGNSYGGRNDRNNDDYGHGSSDYGYGGYGEGRGNKKERRNEGYDNNGDYSTQYERELANAKRAYV